MQQAAAALLTWCTCFLVGGAAGASVFRHKWDTVADLMGMHGQGGSAVPSSIEFAANHYGMITTAAPCDSEGAATIEDGTLAVARKLKAVKPAALVGMYDPRLNGMQSVTVAVTVKLTREFACPTRGIIRIFEYLTYMSTNITPGPTCHAGSNNLVNGQVLAH